LVIQQSARRTSGQSRRAGHSHIMEEDDDEDRNSRKRQYMC